MDYGPKLAQVAALVGDPARANMLASLMSGRALTASELAHLSGVTPQTASGHLAKLGEAGLLTPEKQGRHRYYRLASPLVGQMLEALMRVAPSDAVRPQARWRHGEALRTARTCYDHLAGRIGVSIADTLARKFFVVLDADGGQVTQAGAAWLQATGIHLPYAGKRVFCRPCLDWSERRPHLAGRLGAALLTQALERDWVARIRDSRALTITPAGQAAFAGLFGIEMGGPAA